MAPPLPTDHRYDPINEAVTVLAAALELEDTIVALIARRVIDTLQRGEHPRQADLLVLAGYFR
jgi:hypothetical protein